MGCKIKTFFGLLSSALAWLSYKVALGVILGLAFSRHPPPPRHVTEAPLSPQLSPCAALRQCCVHLPARIRGNLRCAASLGCMVQAAKTIGGESETAARCSDTSTSSPSYVRSLAAEGHGRSASLASVASWGCTALVGSATVTGEP
jgi:hypothetical protein